MSFHLKNWAKLYSNPTDAEKAIEPAIASLGVPYRFQHPVWALSVFPDFALPAHKVIIEVDDKSHNGKAKKAADAVRTAKLNKLGWKVVRCTNDQAESDPYTTVDRMMQEAGLTLRTKRKE